MTSLILRRPERGVRRSDVPFAVAASPLHFVTGLLSAALFALVPLVGVPASRWIVALSRPDRAERAAVALVTRQLAVAGAALMGERIR